MKFVNKQAVCQTVSGQIDYVSPENTQIRAFSVFNPTLGNVEYSVSLNGKMFVKRTVTPNATEVLSALFNHQIGKDERLTITGDGLNVWLTVVDIVV